MSQITITGIINIGKSTLERTVAATNGKITPANIDALEVADNITPEIWAENVGSFSLYYQPAADGRETVLSLRHRLAQRARERAAV